VDKYTLTATAEGPGSVALDPPGGTYEQGTKVKLTATADAGGLFTSWSGDLTGSDNPATITMDADKAVTANFVQTIAARYILTVNIAGEGSVSLDPAGGVYYVGTVVSMTAAPAGGWELTSWSGTDDDGSTGETNTVTITGKKTVTVQFELIRSAALQDGDGTTGCCGTGAPLAVLCCAAFILLGKLRFARRYE